MQKRQTQNLEFLEASNLKVAIPLHLVCRGLQTIDQIIAFTVSDRGKLAQNGAAGTAQNKLVVKTCQRKKESYQGKNATR